VAEKTFRKLNAPELCADVYHGTPYEDGVRLTTKETNRKRVAA